MNKREYLKSQGFKVGERGRLSPAMLTALENSGIDFTKTLDKPEVIDVIYVTDNIKVLPPEKPLQRQPRTLYGRTRDGSVVGFVICSSCNDHMMYCNCSEGVHAPNKVIFSKEPEVKVGKTV